MQIRIYIRIKLRVVVTHALFVVCATQNKSYLMPNFARLSSKLHVGMGLLPETQNCGMRMRRECRERFPRRRLQRKPLVSDPDMHHGTRVTPVPSCMSGLLIRGGGENVPGIPGACTTRNIAYLVRGPCRSKVIKWKTMDIITYTSQTTSIYISTKLCY